MTERKSAELLGEIVGRAGAATTLVTERPASRADSDREGKIRGLVETLRESGVGASTAEYERPRTPTQCMTLPLWTYQYKS